MKSSATSISSRNLGLDLLRLIAVVLVMGNHLLMPKGLESGPLVAWGRGGWVGVDLFFVLSGYLVSGLLFKEYQSRGRVSLGRFLIRRGLKIYPAFWVMIAVSLVFFSWRNRPVPLPNLMGELLFVQNYTSHIWAHTWSLAVEEHFYFGLALLTWLMLRRQGANPFARLPLVFALVATACLIMRAGNAALYPDYEYTHDLFPTHLRIDSLFFGVLLAYLTYFRQLDERLRWFRPWWRVAAGAALLLPAFIFARETNRWVSVVGFNLFYLGSGLLVLGAVNLRTTSSRLLNILGAVGAASYSIYLWHLPVDLWLGNRLLRDHEADPLRYALYLGVCVFGAMAIGYGMARAVEWPVLRLRDKFYPAREASSVTVPLPSSPSAAPVA